MHILSRHRRVRSHQRTTDFGRTEPKLSYMYIESIFVHMPTVPAKVIYNVYPSHEGI